ncbi:unnamed protein product, partial [marine sediment metagenome]
QAINKIYELAKEKNLKVGDKLPPERELVKILEISRSSLREAIRALEMIGVINVTQGRGMVIESSKISNSIIKPLAFSIILNKNTFLELFEARKLIEVECAGLAAERVTTPELKKVKEIYNQLIKHQHNREKSIKYEIKLHEEITEIAKNNILGDILSSIKKLLRESRDTTVPSQGVTLKTINFHEKLIQAFEAKDASKARKLMFEHLDIVSKRLKKSYDTT